MKFYSRRDNSPHFDNVTYYAYRGVVFVLGNKGNSFISQFTPEDLDTYYEYFIKIGEL